MSDSRKSNVAGIVNRLIGRDSTTPNRRIRGDRRRALRVEQLEARRVFAGLVFDSVIPLGNGSEFSQVNDVASDSAGNQFVTGSFRGTVDFDPHAIHAGDTDILTSLGDKGSIFVAKYTPDGSLAWAQRMGSDTYGLLKSENGSAIVVDELDNIFVTGSFYYTAEFGSASLTSAGGQDGFLMKLDSLGQVRWATGWGTSGSEIGRSLAFADDGNLIVVGAGPSETSIQKFDVLSGSQIWTKPIGSNSLGVGGKIAVDEIGNIFLTNAFGPSIDVAPGVGTQLIGHGVGSQSTYLLKLSSTADYQWSRVFETLPSSPTYGRSYPKDIAVDSNGNVIVSGYYKGAVDFNPSASDYYQLPEEGGSFIAKFDTSGDFLWVQPTEVSNVIVVDEADNIYAFASSAISLDSAGQLRWASQLTDAVGYEVTVSGVSIDAQDRVRIVGSFDSSVDFDSGSGQTTLSPTVKTGFLQTLHFAADGHNGIPIVLFTDSFEVGQWNGLWVQDSQNDFFRSSQRATIGGYSAEVDGSANNATLTTATDIDLSSMQTATLTFDWLIESGFDASEYLSLDISTNGGSSWIQDVRRLNGNVDTENVWHSETVDLAAYTSSNLKIRFRSKVSASDEDANVDNVRITAIPAGPNTPPVAGAGGPYAMNEGESVTLTASGSTDSDGTISNYAWDFDGDGQYDDASGATPSFTTTDSGSYVVGLQITDNRGATATATTNITVNNLAPTANAGSDASGIIGASIVLSASGSTDPGNDIVSYVWDLDNDGQYDDASTVTTSFMSAVAGTFSISVQVTDADGAVSFDSAVMTISSSVTKFYVINDASTNRTYEYDPTGTAIENYALNSGNSAPRGAASTVAGTTVWVADKNRKVYVYDTEGGLKGYWSAGTLSSKAQVEGVATNGSDVWIVDNQSDKVYRYTNAAGKLSGSQNAASSFPLNYSNTNPKGIVTDGNYLWVVNDSSTDKVFKYTLSGTLVGSWTIDSGNQAPTGLTIDPANGSQNIWIVDNGTDRVYEYVNGRTNTSGSKAANATFYLASGNSNPQGIADPPPTAAISNTKTATVVDNAIGIPSLLSGYMFSVTDGTRWPLAIESTDSKVQELNSLGLRRTYPNAVRVTIASQDITALRSIAPTAHEVDQLFALDEEIMDALDARLLEVHA